MDCNNENTISICSFFGVITSILVGAIVGVLYALCFIPSITIAVWIAFGLGVLTLIFLVTGVFLAAVCQSCSLIRCLCRNSSYLLVGIIGTIISAIAALSIFLNHFCIPAIIVIALGAFFFTLMIFGLINFITCVIRKTYYFHKE